MVLMMAIIVIIVIILIILIIIILIIITIQTKFLENPLSRTSIKDDKYIVFSVLKKLTNFFI